MPRVTVPSAGQYGVISDITPVELPINAWSSASNMRFRDGYAERFEGQVSIFTAPSVTPYHITPYSTSTAHYWIHSGLERHYADDGTTRSELTPAAISTGSIDDRFTGGVLNGVFILNNGIDKPWYWGGNVANHLAYLTAWPANTRCNSLRPWSNYLVMVNVLKNKGTASETRYPHMVKWSQGADPGTIPASYDETDASIDAGERDLAETPGLMVDSLPLGNMNIIYKEDAMYAQSYIGGQEIFSFQRLPGNFGMLARGCAADTPLGHVVLGQGDVILHSGQGPQSILTGKVRRALFNAIDATYQSRCFLVADRSRNEVWICYPDSGSSVCTTALVWNWLDQSLTYRALSNVTYGNTGPLSASFNSTYNTVTATYDSTTQSYNSLQVSTAESKLILCDTAPLISMADYGTDFNGSAYSAYLERTDLVFDGDTGHMKTILGVYPRISGSTGMTVYIQVGGRNDIEAGVSWSTPVAYTVGSSLWARTRATWRFPAIRFYTTAAVAWRLKSYDLEVVSGGTR